MSDLPPGLRAKGNQPVANDQREWTHMPFGKFANHDLKDVPTYYLKWFLENVDDRKNGLHYSVEAELWTRTDA